MNTVLMGSVTGNVPIVPATTNKKFMPDYALIKVFHIRGRIVSFHHAVTRQLSVAADLDNAHARRITATTTPSHFRYETSP